MRVAIIGGAKSKDSAPWHDTSWGKWVLGNQLDQYDPSCVDKIFEIHENLDEHDANYPKWLYDFNKPMVVSDKFPLSRGDIEVFDYSYQPIGENYSSSPAVMMAQAIKEGAKEIAVYGVNMALDEHEYYMQRPSMEKWLGYAIGLGIKVKVHKDSSLGYTTYREGRDWPNKGFTGFDKGYYLDKAEFHHSQCVNMESEIQNLIQAQERLEQLKAQYQAHDGAMQAYESMLKTHRAKKAGIDIDG